MDKQRLAILGSTGSIGQQSLEIVEKYSDLFEVNTLTAHNNWQLLVEQAIKFQPDSVVIANEEFYPIVKESLKDHLIKVYAGSDAVEQVVASTEVDTVVTALVGYSGLFPTVNAIKHSKKIALANKETLVVAGEHIMKLLEEYNAPMIPVDSEHSAIFQSIVGEVTPIEKIIITASGGPFRLKTKEELDNVTVAEALNHPNWVMGSKITIDSATMMNKGFEVIEAKWLFNLKPEQIEVVVHPSSAIHSMVQFRDGAIKAQMGLADMKLPIQYALTFPLRLEVNSKRFSFDNGTSFDFYTPDLEKFPLLRVAYEAMERGGSTSCTMNGANEIAVSEFLKGNISFTDISRIVEKSIEIADFTKNPSLDDYKIIDAQSREIALSLI
ncbi:MAG: 1-deoxy-D-xylulose-5-phosphate reductoisomerase [Rikenellaceae bacterium]